MDIITSFHHWFKAQQQNFDALVFDVDGVLIHGQEPIQGAAEMLETVTALGKPFLLLTNDGSGSVEEKHRLLTRCGLKLRPEQIVSCSHGLEEVARQRNLKGELFFVMGRLGKPCYAELAGLRITRELNKLAECKGVIIGENNYDWEPTLNAVVNALIKQPLMSIIVPNPDEYYADGNGGIILAAGAIGRFIQAMLERRGQACPIVYLGKPYKPIFSHAHNLLEQLTGGAPIPKDRVLILGDSMASDVAGGNAFGYCVCLILTGITTREMLASATNPPRHVFERI